ncbi:hypothetical protein BH11BAC6_BH11BAC6_15760 [soil metagenome]
MKKAMIRMLFVFMLMASFATGSYAQRFYVKIKPTAVVTVQRPPMPHKGYVWIDGDYTWRNNAYAWKEGYWAAPPRARAAWVPGHWMDEKRGSYWVRGHWRY